MQTNQNLSQITEDTAREYLEAASDDELEAALLLAADRNRAEGFADEPDEQEIHHALFLLRRARGLDAPSFDSMRIALRKRVAA